MTVRQFPEITTNNKVAAVGWHAWIRQSIEMLEFARLSRKLILILISIHPVVGYLNVYIV